MEMLTDRSVSQVRRPEDPDFFKDLKDASFVGFYTGLYLAPILASFRFGLDIAKGDTDSSIGRAISIAPIIAIKLLIDRQYSRRNAAIERSTILNS